TGDRNSDGDREVERIERGAREDEREDDLLRRVGARRDGVGAEDRERLLLRQAFADLLLGGKRPADRDALDAGSQPAHARGRRARGRLRGELTRPRIAEVRRVRAIDADPPVTRLPAAERSTAADHRMRDLLEGTRWTADPASLGMRSAGAEA